MKTSLVISDKEKYGADSPMASPVNSKSKPEERQHAPTIELTGPQVEAFGLDKCNVGDKGSAEIHFVVRSVKAGDEYGSSLPTKNSPKKVTISVTHCDPEEGADGDDEEPAAGGAEAGEAAEPAAEEAAETPAEEDGEEADETDEEDAADEPADKKKKKGKKKKPAAERDAESSTSERVSPADAALPD